MANRSAPQFVKFQTVWAVTNGAFFFSVSGRTHQFRVFGWFHGALLLVLQYVNSFELRTWKAIELFLCREGVKVLNSSSHYLCQQRTASSDPCPAYSPGPRWIDCLRIKCVLSNIVLELRTVLHRLYSPRYVKSYSWWLSYIWLTKHWYAVVAFPGVIGTVTPYSLGHWGQLDH